MERDYYMEMSKRQKQTLIIFAFRYALDRKTTASGEVIQILLNEWDSLDDWVKDQIRGDIKRRLECDDGWKKLLI